MPHYELLFSHDFILGGEALDEGAAFRYRSEVWRVERVEPRAGHPARVYLALWPNELPYPAHICGESDESSADAKRGN